MVSPIKFKIKISVFLIAILISGYGFGARDSFAQSEKYVRVAIIQESKYLSLKVRGFFEIRDGKNDRVLYRGKDLKTTVTGYKNGILIGKTDSVGNRLFIRTDGDTEISINGRMFRGSIQFIKNNNLTLSVINYIGLEDYIAGILYHEASHYWPMEALKAQAIISRTYAVYQMQENKLKNYDVTSDIYSQVYGGKTSERYRTNKAVEETKGIILTYKDKVFPTYYHATCSGHTEDASLLWNINIAPLKGVVCGFCKDSPHFNWHYVLSLDEIEKKLTDAGYKISRIKDITVLGKDNSGRITDLKLLSNKKELKIPAKDFRNIMGPNIIRSTNFKVSVVDKDAVFEGIGWGHGAGLCQWGAYFMAKQGYQAEEILKYYYPGADVKTNGF